MLDSNPYGLVYTIRFTIDVMRKFKEASLGFPGDIISPKIANSNNDII